MMANPSNLIYPSMILFITQYKNKEMYTLIFPIDSVQRYIFFEHI